MTYCLPFPSGDLLEKLIVESQTSLLLPFSPFALIFSYNDCGRLDLINEKKYGFLQRKRHRFLENHTNVVKQDSLLVIIRSMNQENGMEQVACL